MQQHVLRSRNSHLRRRKERSLVGMQLFNQFDRKTNHQNVNVLKMLQKIKIKLIFVLMVCGVYSCYNVLKTLSKEQKTGNFV